MKTLRSRNDYILSDNFSEQESKNIESFETEASISLVTLRND